MKTIVVFTALLAVAVALPRLQRRQVEFEPSQITLTRSLPYDGNSQKDYSFGYSQTDGQTRDEVAQIEVNDSGDTVVRVQGSYSWVNPEDGQVYSITYFADENGFQPTGAHIPVAPAA